MELADVSACLITREAEYPPSILAALPQFGELLITTKCPNVHGRYELIARAKHETVYVQDDDAIVDAKSLLARYDGRITNWITAHHKNYYAKQCNSRISLIGWGAYFPRSFGSVLERYREKFGADALYLREADRIVTWFHAPHNTVITSAIKHLPQHRRMSHEAHHYKSLNQIISRLQSLGESL